MASSAQVSLCGQAMQIRQIGQKKQAKWLQKCGWGEQSPLSGQRSREQSDLHGREMQINKLPGKSKKLFKSFV